MENEKETTKDVVVDSTLPTNPESAFPVVAKPEINADDSITNSEESKKPSAKSAKPKPVGNKVSLGLTIINVAGGVRVKTVTPDEPMAVAGVLEGDIIIAVGGKATPDKSQFASITALLRPNSKFPIKLERDGKIIGMLVKIPADPSDARPARQSLARSSLGGPNSLPTTRMSMGGRLSMGPTTTPNKPNVHQRSRSQTLLPTQAAKLVPDQQTPADQNSEQKLGDSGVNGTKPAKIVPRPGRSIQRKPVAKAGPVTGVPDNAQLTGPSKARLKFIRSKQPTNPPEASEPKPTEVGQAPTVSNPSEAKDPEIDKGIAPARPSARLTLHKVRTAEVKQDDPPKVGGKARLGLHKVIKAEDTSAKPAVPRQRPSSKPAAKPSNSLAKTNGPAKARLGVHKRVSTAPEDTSTAVTIADSGNISAPSEPQPLSPESNEQNFQASEAAINQANNHESAPEPGNPNSSGDPNSVGDPDRVGA